MDVAAIRLPRISNFTDLDALAVEPAVRLRLVDHAAALGRPDLVILPGTKATVADLGWLHQRGLAAAICALAAEPDGRTTILGICGGYQMLGDRIDDAVESRPAQVVPGLGLLGAETVFDPEKVTNWTIGRALGTTVSGYEIHHGHTRSSAPWIALDGAGGPNEGCQAGDGQVRGTNLHGLLETDAFRDAFLAEVAHRAGRATWAASGVSFAAAREDRFDRLAAALEDHLDMPAIERLIGGATKP